MSLGDLAMLLEISPTSFRTYLERREGILAGVGLSYLLDIVTSWFKTM